MSFMGVQIQTFIQTFANTGGFLWEAWVYKFNGMLKVEARIDYNSRVNNLD